MWHRRERGKKERKKLNKFDLLRQVIYNIKNPCLLSLQGFFYFRINNIGGLYMKKNTLKITLAIIIVVIFTSLAILVKGSQGGILFDEKIMESVHANTNSTITTIMKGITFLGSSLFFIGFGVVLAFLFIRNKYYEGIIPLFLSTIGTYGVNAILKNIFVRIRPLKYFLIEQGGYSFPSGHSMVSMSFYTTMTYLFLKSRDKRTNDLLIWILNFLLIGLIGFSRIYLGVHWPTDVLSGYIMGFLMYIIIITIYERQTK